MPASSPSMSGKRFSARAVHQSEKSSHVPAASGTKLHKLTKPRQTWTAPVTAASPSTRTPHRASKDLALARLLAPVYLDSPYAHEKTVTKRCSTLPRLSQRTPSTAADLHSPVKRLRSLSIHTSAKTDINKVTTTRANPVRQFRRDKRHTSEGDADSDYEAVIHTPSSVSSDDAESTAESEDSSLSDSSSDSECSMEWMRRRRRRIGVKPTAILTPVTKKPAPRSGTGSIPRVPSKPVSRNSVRGSSVPGRVHSTPTRTEPITEKGLPGRENEFDTIYTFINERLTQQSGGCMYISGLPGTGKTASVNAVLSKMSKNSPMAFQKVVVSGMQVSEPRQVYTQICQQLTGKVLSAKQAVDRLDHEFSTHPISRVDRSDTSTSTPVVLVIDELDLLCTKRQDVLYRLFDWPARPQARRCLIVLTIANTMDLPDRLLHSRVASRLGMARLTFAPYTHEQLIHIIRSRLAVTTRRTFQDQAVELAARKVAAVSGDVRRALDICRRAAEMASGCKSAHQIGIEHINAALKEMFASPKVNAIRSCSVYEKLFLRALVAELQTRNAEEARLDRCIMQMCALCRLEGFACPTTSEVFDICSGLGAYKLLLTEDTRRDCSMLIRLNCSRSDVLFAFKPPVGA